MPTTEKRFSSSIHRWHLLGLYLHNFAVIDGKGDSAPREFGRVLAANLTSGNQICILRSNPHGPFSFKMRTPASRSNFWFRSSRFFVPVVLGEHFQVG